MLNVATVATFCVLNVATVAMFNLSLYTKGKELEQEYEEDNFKTVVKDLEIITETKVKEEVNKPIHGTRSR